jgi:aspartate-semialdehyde dehydrogenase
MSLEVFTKVAIVGATGAVGREALAILAARGIPKDRIVPLASERSVGMCLPYGDDAVTVRALTHEAVECCDAAIFAASADIAKEYAPRAAAKGVVIVDNSSAFRAHPDVPLVVPEINAQGIESSNLIANPNCSTIIMLLALEPLKRAFGVREITVSTYQAVSGAGIEAVGEMYNQSREKLDAKKLISRVFAEPIAFNVFPHESTMDPDTGLNGEESKMISESRRIWADPALRIFPTCVRVPVERAHSQAIIVTLDEKVTKSKLISAYEGAAGVSLADLKSGPPTPLKASGRDNVLVGRLRMDPSGDPCRVGLWACGDQLRKGAALNAIQILDRKGLSGHSTRGLRTAS